MPLIKLQGSEFIYQRFAGDGRLTSYQVKIRRRSFPSKTASFRDLNEARRFVRQALVAQDRGHKIDHLTAQRVSVGDVIDDAIAKIDNGRRRTKGSNTERIRLNAFRRDFYSLCGVALADVPEEIFEDWIAERLEGVKPNTVLREYRLLKPILAAAARKYDLQRSPLEYVKPPSTIDERVRRLSADEAFYLFAELQRAQDPVVALAARFALETGCRRGEQLRLSWDNHDRVRGTVWLADEKNGAVVMSCSPKWLKPHLKFFSRPPRVRRSST